MSGTGSYLEVTRCSARMILEKYPDRTRSWEGNDLVIRTFCTVLLLSCDSLSIFLLTS